MIRCGILEEPDAVTAHFRGGLNHEIQDILDYKEYADMNQLFEFACKAEREVQGRRSRTYYNTFVGRNSLSSSAPIEDSYAGRSRPSHRRSTHHMSYTGYHVFSLQRTWLRGSGLSEQAHITHS
jgi:hypothetical protein